MSAAYVLKRTDGKYVAREGSANSYTKRLQDARKFSTQEDAERERCPENESVIRLDAEVSA